MRRGQVISSRANPEYVCTQKNIRAGKNALEIYAGPATLLLQKDNTKNFTVILEGEYNGKVKPEVKVVNQYGEVHIFVQCFDDAANLTLRVVVPNRRYASIQVSNHSKGYVDIQGIKTVKLKVLTTAGNVSFDGVYQKLKIETQTGDITVKGSIKREECTAEISTRMGDVNVQLEGVSVLKWKRNSQQIVHHNSNLDKGFITSLDTTSDRGLMNVKLI